MKPFGEIEEAVLRLPDEIRLKEMDIIRTGDQVAELDKKNEFVKNQTKASVAADKDVETEKPKFTNESLREAELSRRLNDNVEFQEQERKIGELRQFKAVDEVQLRYLQNKLRVRLAILRSREEE